jgi:seryl-tRNA synthetase
MSLAQAHAAFRADLLEAGLLVSSGDGGLYGRSGVFEDVIDAVDRLVLAAGADQDAARFRFPPVFPKAEFEKTDYLASFPNLTGSVTTFKGDDRAHAELLAVRARDDDWERLLQPTGVMLVSAACHPAYRMMAGTLPAGGTRLDIYGYCFRHEPAVDPARMQAFRQHEYVYLGEPAGARAHRETWVARGLELLQSIGLDAAAEVANDPFFGRAGRMLAANQRDETLKIELVVHLYGGVGAGDNGTAIVSSNCHLDHFGEAFGITTSEGDVAHTACVGFGMERIALALLRQHGLDPTAWPGAVRQRLWR